MSPMDLFSPLSAGSLHVAMCGGLALACVMVFIYTAWMDVHVRTSEGVYILRVRGLSEQYRC